MGEACPSDQATPRIQIALRGPTALGADNDAQVHDARQMVQSFGSRAEEALLDCISFRKLRLNSVGTEDPLVFGRVGLEFEGTIELNCDDEGTPMYQIDGVFRIKPDTYDFNYDPNRGWHGNAMTLAGSVLSGQAALLPGRSYEIYTYGSVRVSGTVISRHGLEWYNSMQSFEGLLTVD